MSATNECTNNTKSPGATQLSRRLLEENAKKQTEGLNLDEMT